MMIEKLKSLIDENRVIENELLKGHTTFKVGGPAKALLIINTEKELKEVVSLLKKENELFMIIGNGSNLLVSDKGYDGFVLKLSGEFTEIKIDGNKITAGAGALLSRLCMSAKECSLAGLEFAYGIPGTIGGAMVMNAGAYDGEMSYVVESVDLLLEDGSVKTFSKDEMKFGYRDSILKHMSAIALKTVFVLKPGDEAEIQAHMLDFMDRRKSKQPLEHPSAGSTFKRPEGYFAGKLIQDAGLSGYRVGGACVSPKHCGFVVNDEAGSASDINKLMNDVSKIVFEKFQVTLEPEVIKIGQFD